MQYLQRLPLLLALAGSLVSGLLSLLCLRTHNEVLFQMVLSMIIFYIVGFFIRSMVINVKTQVDAKRLKLEADERAQKEKEEIEEKKKEKTDLFLGKHIDFKVNDLSEDSFEPLPVSEFIKKELKDH